jgi:hypothetical protein
MDGFSVSSLIIGLTSGVISSVLTYFGTRSKIRLDLTVEYDKALHDKRLALYKDLWPITKPLGRFVPHFSLTYNDVKSVVTDMHEWYFKEGGIYLSKNSREPYFQLKKQMLRVIDNERLEATPDARIDDTEACKAILDAATNLRTSLADDIRTRRSPWL